MTLRLPLLFLAAFFLQVSTRPALGADKPEKGIALRLLACEVTEEAPKVFLETKDGKSDDFDLPSSAFTAPMKVSCRAVMIKAPGNDVPLSAITLPDQGHVFAVLLAPKEAEGLKPTIIRLDDDSFKPGDFYFVNCSKEKLVLKLGDTEVVIEAGESLKSRPSGPIGGGFSKVTMSTRGESGDKVFASTRWPVDESKRGYIVFLSGPGARVTYRSIDEFIAKP